jgi:hypothetical protein
VRPMPDATTMLRYGARPEHDWGQLLAMPDDQAAERTSLHDAWRDEDRAWKAHIRRGLSIGRLTHARAQQLGYRGTGHDAPHLHGGWQQLPQDLYHVTTDLPGVQARGLKTRDELAQGHRGLGLGGGESDTISLTIDPELARDILTGLHEYHDAVTGRTSAPEMWEEARAGQGADRPYHEAVARCYDLTWRPGDPLPDGLADDLEGRDRYHGMANYTRHEMHERHGPGWEPADEGWDTPKGRVHAGPWTRLASPEHQAEQRADLYRKLSACREQAGGPANPVFFATDVPGFALLDPGGFALLHVRPRPGAQGYPASGMAEWRTASGEALEVLGAEKTEDRTADLADVEAGA